MKLRIWIVAALALGVGACATVGTSFEFSGPKAITIGTTNKADLVAEFGRPFRVGYDNGSEKWAFAYYRYSVFGQTEVKDLEVIFDGHGVVSSYTYESSQPQEIDGQLPER
jgi:hypothetical protein